MSQSSDISMSARSAIGKVADGRTVMGGASLRKWAARSTIWIFLAIALVVFSLLSPYFFTVYNLCNVLLQGAFVGFLAIGMTLIMINGNIDLTVGSMLGLCACLSVGLQDYGLGVAIIGALAAGGLLGLLNGYLVERTGVDSFIVTLGGMIGIRGLVFVYTQENSLSASSDAFTNFGSMTIGPVSLIALVFLALLLLFQWVLSMTCHGRNAYAVGGNRVAAVNAGIRVSRHVIINFGLSGLLAAVAGITSASQFGAATPNLGDTYELWAIIAVVVGGTKLSGGVGSLWGTLGGVLTLAVLRNGLNLTHVQPFYVFIVMGVALIGALLLDKQFNR
jgi:ribose transport system permease protein